jgi:hypothetical protein
MALVLDLVLTVTVAVEQELLDKQIQVLVKVVEGEMVLMLQLVLL